MSKQKGNKDFVFDGTISEEAMIAYLNNELTPVEKQQFDQLLAADPFAQDALEGLQAVKNKEAITESIASINKKVRHQTGGKEHKVVAMHWTNYAWAAAILGLLVGIAFIMINYLGVKNTNVASNEPKQPDTSTHLMETTPTATAPVNSGTIAAKDSTVQSGSYNYTQDINKVDSSSASYSLTQKNDAVVKKREEAKGPVSGFVSNMNDSVSTKTYAWKQNQANNTSPAANMNSTITAENNNGKAGLVSVPSMTGTSGAKQIVVNDADKNYSITAEKKKSENGDGGAKVPDNNAIGNSEIRGKKEITTGATTENVSADKSTVTMYDAMKNFNSQNYKLAAEQFDALLKKQPDNADALYFGGMSDYFNGKLGKSENNFDKLLKKGSTYVDGSKWYKANILIQKGKKDEAKKLLNELSNSTGSFKERAVKKLQEM